MNPAIITPPIFIAPITSPTELDVINGRGQGVQRHPGNMKYRNVVYLNKGLYAKCPRSDKSKISKGIVAAIRQVGGRFLEFDEASGVYNDIGDKKAYEKTSQALREGQSKIKKQMYKEMGSKALQLQHEQREVSSAGYFGYSVQLLLSLHRASQTHHQISPNPAPEVVCRTEEV